MQASCSRNLITRRATVVVNIQLIIVWALRVFSIIIGRPRETLDASFRRFLGCHTTPIVVSLAIFRSSSSVLFLSIKDHFRFFLRSRLNIFFFFFSSHIIDTHSFCDRKSIFQCFSIMINPLEDRISVIIIF